MLKIATGFSLRYGMCVGNLADALDADPFDVLAADLGPYLDSSVMDMRNDARESGESSILRPWLEFLIASTKVELKALGIPYVRGHADVVLPIYGVDALPEESWRHILKHIRSTLLGGADDLSQEEARAVRASVTIIEETLEDFRIRMRAEGRLDPPVVEGA